MYGVTGTIITFALDIGASISLGPALNHFASIDIMEDDRGIIFSATLDGILDFSRSAAVRAPIPISSMPSTPSNWGHPSSTTHTMITWSGYSKGGVFAVLLIALLIGLYSVQWRKIRTQEDWSQFWFLQVGTGIGIFPLLLHELVDYNLFIPANMVYFAFLAGIFFRDPNQEATNRTRCRRPRQPPAQVQARLQTRSPNRKARRPNKSKTHF